MRLLWEGPIYFSLSPSDKVKLRSLRLSIGSAHADWLATAAHWPNALYINGDELVGGETPGAQHVDIRAEPSLSASDDSEGAAKILHKAMELRKSFFIQLKAPRGWRCWLQPKAVEGQCAFSALLAYHEDDCMQLLWEGKLSFMLPKQGVPFPLCKVKLIADLANLGDEWAGVGARWPQAQTIAYQSADAVPDAADRTPLTVVICPVVKGELFASSSAEKLTLKLMELQKCLIIVVPEPSGFLVWLLPQLSSEGQFSFEGFIAPQSASRLNVRSETQLT